MSAALAVLFLAVYGSTNTLAARRAGVSSLNFAWESQIPVIPLFIIPYISSDAFFLAAPFLARSRRELAVLTRRIVFATLVAGVCFLVVPQKFAYPRPEFSGFLGTLFSLFHQMDPPFNEFPSLHITYCLILADLYLRHTRGILRMLTAIWFVLLFVSPIFTWQHHLLDIAGGVVLAALAIHLFDMEPLRWNGTANPRVRDRYLLASVLLVALAFVWRPWTLALLWPAVAFCLAGFAYAGIGPGIYRKRNGRLPWTTWLLLWPVLLGQRLSVVYYAGRSRAWDELTERVWIGRRLSGSQASDAKERGVVAVLDLTCEFSEAPPLRGTGYLQLPTLDLTAPAPPQLARAVAFIQEHAARGIVYVHCKLGYSRTAAVAGAYLLAMGQAASAEEAILLLQKARPGIIIRPEARRAIEQFAARPAIVEGANV